MLLHHFWAFVACYRVNFTFTFLMFLLQEEIIMAIFFSFGATAPSGPGPPHSRGF